MSARATVSGGGDITFHMNVKQGQGSCTGASEKRTFQTEGLVLAETLRVREQGQGQEFWEEQSWPS